MTEVQQVHAVNRPLAELGVWKAKPDGWSLLAMQIASPGAASIAVRLRELRLPKQYEVWVCGMDGKQRLGPLRETEPGEIWTDSLPGTRVRLEIWVPERSQQELSGAVSEVYAGYK